MAPARRRRHARTWRARFLGLRLLGLRLLGLRLVGLRLVGLRLVGLWLVGLWLVGLWLLGPRLIRRFRSLLSCAPCVRWVASRGGLLRRRLALRDSADALGRRGERAAVRALRRAGYRILARRFRTRGGEEVDVVALDGATLVVVEVKATASAMTAPGDRVDHRKRERLRAAAACLLRRVPGRARPVRIDVVLVRLEGRRARAEIRPGHTRLS